MRRVILLLTAMALALVLASGVAWGVNKVGTNGPDNLMGTDKADTLLGKGGNDDLFGLKGRDNLVGGPGKDWVIGGSPQDRSMAGDKNQLGGPGNDGVFTGQGSDNALGGGGNDLLVDGDFREFSHDNFSGGPGTDAIVVWHKPAFEDIVVCGTGFDRVLADPKDVVAPDCERVQILQGPLEELLQQEDEFFTSPPIVALEAGLTPPPI
jgi:Ca2+-binding RTX toxin-like protein